MKNILIYILSLFLLLQTSVSKAGDYAPIQYSIYSVQNSLVFRLALQNEEAQEVSLSIYNSAGELLYTEKNNQIGSSIKSYDMHLFGAGTYTVVIETQGFKTTETVKVGVSKAKVMVQNIKLKTNFQDLIDHNAEVSKQDNLSLSWLKTNYLLDMIEENTEITE
jgi:hypothetical protein